MHFKIALLQIAPSPSVARNLDIGLACCRRAKSLGADLALFPELWNIGAAPPPLTAGERESWTASAIDANGDFLRAFRALARELEMNIAVTWLEARRPKPHNSVSIINHKGEFALHYSKVFICDFGQEELLKPHANPSDVGCDVLCSPGDSFDVCTLNGADGDVRVGAMICSDREFPEPAGRLMQNGAELIVVPNACTWDDVRTAGLKTRAFENLVGVAMTNYPAPFSNGASQAYSCVPWKNGKEADMLIARAGAGEEIAVASFDVAEIREFRTVESWRMEYRRRAARSRTALP